MDHLLRYLFSAEMAFTALSGFFLYRLCTRFVAVKTARWAKVLLFATMFVSSTVVVWIGDNNFAITLPFYAASFLLATKGDRLGRLTMGGIFFCLIMSVCAMTDTYLVQVQSDERLYRLLSMGPRPPMFGIFYALFYRRTKKGPVQLPHKLWNLCAGLTLLPFGALSVLILSTYYRMPYSATARELTRFQGVFLLPLTLFASVALLYSILILADYEEKSQAAALAELREIYYQGLQREQTQLRTLRHDLRNHLNTALGLLERGETEKARRYLGELTDSPALGQTRRFCENELVNVVLSSKCQEMALWGIRGDLEISLPAELPLGDTDLCALLGNALDNAIEAARKAADKTITLRCRAERGMFLLLVKNALAGDEREDLRTTKADKTRHGLGLKGMAEIASRYGGILEAGPREDQFELIVNIPLAQEPGTREKERPWKS